MSLQEKLQNLASENTGLAVSISLNTHRTFPENQQDEIVLKNLIREAENRVIDEYGKRPAAGVLEKLEKLEGKINHQYNLDSLHIFLSNETEEIIKSTWKSRDNLVEVDEKFSVRPLIKAVGRVQEYLILLLAQSGTKLYEAMNDAIITEIHEEGFPFPQNPFYITSAEVRSDAKQVDNQIKEYFNRIDKAVVEIHKKTGMEVIVISTSDNYTKLLEVADLPAIYIGHDNKNYSEAEEHHIVEQAYEIIKEKQKEDRKAAIEEVKEAVSQGMVLTDLHEIYQAALDGRGELLIIHQDFEQPVRLTDDRSFEYAEDSKEPGVVDDIVSIISWEVLSKNGKVHFTTQEELLDLGKIVLKTRY
ncbi:hypothetical protein B0A69_05895 [Chryseobacterium shigense]|uniref:Peptide chain release factor 1 (ERF1) n=1 Tax=Chryseobacterium shigense TaxID=297244 RepID=A0A1N7IK77_9FLAO|nr:hypothetical protein [Chryseobacterium shigense]PQA95900.1 hypothetical protein B0A69_05895 [Chryseobacterium shigense]SIS37391.1 hypothetical protein SAMN05421639_10486 [Chryseobacterium shigense]